MNNTLTLEYNITKLTLPSKMDSGSESSSCSVYTEQELSDMYDKEEFDIHNVNDKHNYELKIVKQEKNGVIKFLI